MNRRDLLGGAGAIGAALSAAAGVVGIAAQAAPTNPDAELIEAERLLDAVENGPLVELCRVKSWLQTEDEEAAWDAEMRAQLRRTDAPLLTLATKRAATAEGM